MYCWLSGVFSSALVQVSDVHMSVMIFVACCDGDDGSKSTTDNISLDEAEGRPRRRMDMRNSVAAVEVVIVALGSIIDYR